MSGASNFVSGDPTTMREAVRFFLRHRSPRFLIAVVAFASAARLCVGAWSSADALVVLAILALWPIQEWLIHAFVLHFEPIRAFGRTFDFEVPRSHRIHHRDPWNLDILFIPVQGYFIGLPLLLLIAFGLLPAPLALTATIFHLAMTLQYEWWHFLVHTRVRPERALHRRLWRNHRLHHCKNEHYWYGVSMLLGDTLLGTDPSPTEVETSETCRTLGIEDPSSPGAV